jgi:hypothetical protein
LDQVPLADDQELRDELPIPELSVPEERLVDELP